MNVSRAGRPVHLKDFDPYLDPFHEDEQPQHHRWLIMTCIAGIAGLIVIGTILLGLFGSTSGVSQAW